MMRLHNHHRPHPHPNKQTILLLAACLAFLDHRHRWVTGSSSISLRNDESSSLNPTDRLHLAASAANNHAHLSPLYPSSASGSSSQSGSDSSLSLHAATMSNQQHPDSTQSASQQQNELNLAEVLSLNQFDPSKFKNVYAAIRAHPNLRTVSSKL